ncbi:MAG: hypothetical protein IJ772_02815 [Bacilli bacterium]|nr:hypothetical protein [Bacilli bacterium]
MKNWMLKHKKTVLPVLLVFGLTIGYTAAKYIIEEFHSYYTNSKHFYFTSNILTKEESLYQVNNWIGMGSFTLSYDLFSKDNEYVYTDYDIPYETFFTCPEDVICSIDKPTGTIYQASHSDTVTLSVSPTRPYQEGETMTIELRAKSTSPYVTELKAKFEYIVGKQGVTYEIEDQKNQAYLLLKVTSALSYCTITEAFSTYSVGDSIERSVYNTFTPEEKKKCHGQDVHLDFDPSILRLDTTSNILENATNTKTTVGDYEFINHLDFNIAPMSTIAVKFYKQQPSMNYTYPITNSSSIVTVTFE